jgi:hypothetical protein
MRRAGNRTVAERATVAAVFAVVVVAATPALARADDGVDPFAGLERVDDAEVGVAYIDPKADFSVFKRVAISDPYVAFRANWRRDQNRNRIRPITTGQMDRIRATVASLFKEVLTETLEADDGYEVVEVADYDVLLVKPAIIDLDFNAPERGVGGASTTVSASTGSATLYLELFDSVSGDIIGRAADRQDASTNRHFGLAGEALAEAQARRIFEGWASTLRGFLDAHYRE